MKKVVIFGAAGHTGKYLTRKMQKAADVELSVFVRNPAKFGDMIKDETLGANESLGITNGRA